MRWRRTVTFFLILCIPVVMFAQRTVKPRPTASRPSVSRTPSATIPSPMTDLQKFYYLVAIYGYARTKTFGKPFDKEGYDNVDFYGETFDNYNYRRAMADEFERNRYRARIRAQIEGEVRKVDFNQKFSLVSSKELGEYSFATHSFPFGPQTSINRNQFSSRLPMSETDANAFVKSRANESGNIKRTVTVRSIYSVVNDKAGFFQMPAAAYTPYLNFFVYSVEVFSDESMKNKMGEIPRISLDPPNGEEWHRRAYPVITDLAAGSVSAGTIRKNQFGMELVYIPPGEFIMGSSEAEVDRSVEVRKIFKDNEARFGCEKFKAECEWKYFRPGTPQRKVTIKDGFWIGKFEVTQKEWQSVMNSNPNSSSGCGLDCPVNYLTWNEVQDFLRRLNGRGDGFEYSLPSEAQWEYAARAGSTTIFAYGDNSTSGLEKFDGSYPFGSAKRPDLEKFGRVGRYQPNAWGLYDMHENVWEWCQDIYSSNYQNLPSDGSANMSIGDSSLRVLRGGTWSRFADRPYSQVRFSNDSSPRYSHYGFRVAARMKK